MRRRHAHADLPKSQSERGYFFLAMGNPCWIFHVEKCVIPNYIYIYIIPLYPVIIPLYGCVWKWLVPHCTQIVPLGEWGLINIWVCLKMVSTPLYPMVLLIIIPFWNGYFIGNINPTFSDKAMWCPVCLQKIGISIPSANKTWQR